MNPVARVLRLSAAALTLSLALLTAPAWAEPCTVVTGSNGEIDIAAALKGCAPANSVLSEAPDQNLTANAGLKDTVMKFVTRLTQLGALLAIAGIVYSGFLMVTSTGDDEKASTGKKGLIWSAAGFAAMILAPTAVNAVINMAYGTIK